MRMFGGAGAAPILKCLKVVPRLASSKNPNKQNLLKFSSFKEENSPSNLNSTILVQIN